jgi:hypothetical protein
MQPFKPSNQIQEHQLPPNPATPEKVVTDDPKVSRRSTLALQKGNRSPQVTSLQKKLQSAGYFDGPITGYYGSLTQEAVINFQKAKGLTANGIADEETLQALESSSVTPTPSEKSTSPSGFTNNPKVENRGNLDNPQKHLLLYKKLPNKHLLLLIATLKKHRLLYKKLLKKYLLLLITTPRKHPLLYKRLLKPHLLLLITTPRKHLLPFKTNPKKHLLFLKVR